MDLHPYGILLGCPQKYSIFELRSFRTFMTCNSYSDTVYFPDSFFQSLFFDTEDVNNDFVNKPKRKRGRRGGLLVRSRNKFKRTPLPSLILSNVNRLFNKTDELFARIETHNEFKFCQVFCFTETWLKNDYPDKLMTPPHRQA